MSLFSQPGVRALPIVMALVFSGPTATAHHSFAMYDQSKVITLTGAVREFQWTNPHSVIWIVTGAGRADDVWSVELPTSPGNLSRLGWSKHSLKPGDKVAIDVNPLRDGHHGGSLKKVTILATGEVLSVGAPAAATTPPPAH